MSLHFSGSDSESPKGDANSRVAMETVTKRQCKLLSGNGNVAGLGSLQTKERCKPRALPTNGVNSEIMTELSESLPVSTVCNVILITIRHMRSRAWSSKVLPIAARNSPHKNQKANKPTLFETGLIATNSNRGRMDGSPEVSARSLNPTDSSGTTSLDRPCI